MPRKKVNDKPADESIHDEQKYLQQTVQKQAKEAAIESEPKYFTHVNSTRDCEWATDQYGNYTYVSLNAKDIFGFETNEFIGKNIFDFIPKSQSVQIGNILHNIINSKKPFIALEIIKLHKDGKYITVESSGIPIFDENNNFKGYRGIDRDITECKRSEEALRESEKRFKILSEFTFEGIALVENEIIIDLNEQHARMHGYERNEMIGKHVMELVAPESRERLAEAIRLGEKGPVEYLDLRKDGTTFPVEVRSDIVWIGGRELHLAAVRDISERKQADMALQRERNLLRILIDNLPDLIYFKDAKGRYILDNRAHVHSLGAENEQEVLGKTTFDFNPPELAKQYHEDEIRIVQTGQAMIGKEELALHRDTGQMRWHLTSKIPLKDSQGKVTGFVCISSDITDHKQAEEMLHHERNLLRTLIDNLPDLIYFKDTKGRYILDNRTHLRSLGVENQQDIIGKTTFDFNPPELAKRYHEDEMQIVRTGKAMLEKEEIALHHDTGERRWHLTSKIPLMDNQGKVTGIVGISHDITEKKRIQEALQHERNLLRTLIDNLPDLVFFKDTLGRYILNNLPHLKSIGASKQEDVIGKTTFDYNPPELAKQYHEDEMHVVKTGEALFNREEFALHQDTGEKRWHLTSKIPLLDNQGNVTGIVGIAHDITEKKIADEERERLIRELQIALAEVKTLSGLIPICANCKKIRDDKGFWTQVESYVQEHSEARFSHGICPDCIKVLYPGYCSKE